jgi:hypothetical protein
LHEPALGLLLERLLSGIPDTSEHLHPGLVDIIIFDAAALEKGTDAYLLAAVADATVLIVEAGKEHKDTLHKLSVTFQQFGAPILGVIVNRQQKQHRSYFYAPRQTSSIEERKVTVPPSLDHTRFLPLPQKNTTSVSEQNTSEEILQPSNEEHLPLQVVSCEKDANDTLQIEIASELIHRRGMDAVEIETVSFELPETPAPLPLFAYLDTVASMPTHQTDETQNEPSGRLQFAPLLRLSQGRISGKTSEP